MTMRSHDQYNTTIYGLDDRYRGIRGERRVVFMNAGRHLARGLVERQVVDLISEWHDGDAHAPRASSSSPYPSRAAAPPPTSPRRTRSCRSTASPTASNTPTSKSIVIEVTPSAPG